MKNLLFICFLAFYTSSLAQNLKPIDTPTWFYYNSTVTRILVENETTEEPYITENVHGKINLLELFTNMYLFKTEHSYYENIRYVQAYFPVEGFEYKYETIFCHFDKNKQLIRINVKFKSNRLSQSIFKTYIKI